MILAYTAFWKKQRDTKKTFFIFASGYNIIRS